MCPSAFTSRRSSTFSDANGVGNEPLTTLASIFNTGGACCHNRVEAAPNMRLFAATVFAILLLGALSADLIKVPVYEYGDGSYVVQAGIGSPPQKFTLLIDFRDKFLWVPRKDCGTTTANDCPPQCRDPGKLGVFRLTPIVPF